MTTPATVRRQRLAELLDDYPLQDPSEFLDPAVDLPPSSLVPYVLVERSNVDGLHYMTCHSSPELAAEYHDGQEDVDDWTVVTLVDLNTGASYTPARSTTFQPDPTTEGDSTP